MRYLPDEEEEAKPSYPGVEYLPSPGDPSEDGRYRSDQSTRNSCKGRLLLEGRVDPVVPENRKKAQSQCRVPDPEKESESPGKNQTE